MNAHWTIVLLLVVLLGLAIAPMVQTYRLERARLRCATCRSIWSCGLVLATQQIARALANHPSHPRKPARSA